MPMIALLVVDGELELLLPQAVIANATRSMASQRVKIIIMVVQLNVK
jgi:hypothetical protein